MISFKLFLDFSLFLCGSFTVFSEGKIRFISLIFTEFLLLKLELFWESLSHLKLSQQDDSLILKWGSNNELENS